MSTPRPEHAPKGDPCMHKMPDGTRCKLAADRHRKRDRAEYAAKRRRAAGIEPRPKAAIQAHPPAPAARRRAPKPAPKELPVVALDGEGHNLPCCKCLHDGLCEPCARHCSDPDHPPKEHIYTFLAASTRDHDIAEVCNPKGLSTTEIFLFLFSLEERVRLLYPKPEYDWGYPSKPRHPRYVGYAIDYDKSKWLEGLQNRAVYELDRPDLRRQPGKHELLHVLVHPRGWPEHGLVSLDKVSTRLTLSRGAKFETPVGEVLAVGRRNRGPRPKFKGPAQIVHVWDVFKFFTESFVGALKKWLIPPKGEKLSAEDERQVADLEKQIDAIRAMKEKRGDFSTISDEEKAYCRSECRLLARLAETLFAMLELHNLLPDQPYSPGSVAKKMLSNERAVRHLQCKAPKGLSPSKCTTCDTRPRTPEAMTDAVHRAFFGGRFGLLHPGRVQPAYGYDLASAYAAAEARLPCLRHGRWRLVQGTHAELVRQIRAAEAARGVALVHYALPRHPKIPIRPIRITDEHLSDGLGLGSYPRFPPEAEDSLASSTMPWGPFPYRFGDGSTCFPATSPGGWSWSPEFLAAADHPDIWPNVVAREAWIFTPRCKHPPPFLEPIAAAYCTRLDLGKSSKGLPLKTALAARYGVRAQSVGGGLDEEGNPTPPKHQDWVISALITATVRGQILRAIARARTPSDIVSIATDGIVSKKPLQLPSPPDTGTAEAAARANRKAAAEARAAGTDYKRVYPLGAWEPEPRPKGLFFVRPGLKFSLDLTDTSLKHTAARGVGKRVLHGARERILATWDAQQNAHPDDPVRRVLLRETSDTDAEPPPRHSPCSACAKLPAARARQNAAHQNVHDDEDAERQQLVGLRLQQPAIFHGSKTSLAPRRLGKDGRFIPVREGDYYDESAVAGMPVIRRSVLYGKWHTPEKYKVSTEPLPKRPAINPDGTFATWALPDDPSLLPESAPYDRALAKQEEHVMDLRLAQDIADEQPEGMGDGIGDA